MKVAIINRSDAKGGAAVFTYRLMCALRAQGVDASMLVCDAAGGVPHVVDYAQPIADRYHFLAERWQIFCNNGFSCENLFKVDTADWGRDLSAHPVVRDADVILLNWINQGALSLSSIHKLCRSGKPVVWTMHDMWNCTGICHHAYDCDHYRQQCGCCPYLSSSHSHDLSYRSWCKKNNLYSAPNLHFVAVSNWLAEKCAYSSLLGDKAVTVIPNSLPVDDFAALRRPNADYDIPSHRKLIALGAARLDDPVKGFDYLIAATRSLKEHYPQHEDNFHLLLFGDIRDASLLHKIAIPYTYLGSVKPHEVSHILTHADVLLSTALYESFGGTLIEGQAAGCVPVTFGSGGQVDIVEHLRTGYIAQYKSSDDLARGIEWAASCGIERSFLHDEVVRRFSPHVVSRRYIELFNSLLSSSK